MRKKTRYSDKHFAIYVPSLGGGGAERVMVTLGNAFADRVRSIGKQALGSGPIDFREWR